LLDVIGANVRSKENECSATGFKKSDFRFLVIFEKTSNNNRIYPKRKLPLKTRRNKPLFSEYKENAGVSQLFTLGFG